MATDRRTESKLADATAKTAAVLETLRTRLKRETPSPEPPIAESQEGPDELDRELKKYFAAEASASPAAKTPTPIRASSEIRIPEDIRSQVIDGVVDRILRSWGAPNGEIPASIKSEVIARLVEHVLGELLKKGANSR